MPVYFANVAKENQRVPESLRKRGLNFLRTAPSQFRISAFPFVRHHYYDIFVSQFYMVAAAIWNRRNTTSGSVEYYLGAAPLGFDYLPFAYPPLAVSFKDVGTNLQKWLHDNDFVQETINDVNLWTKYSGLNSEQVRFLTANPTTIMTTRTPYMYANMSAILGMMQIVKYLSLLSIILDTPALRTEDHAVAYNQTGKRKRSADDTGKTAEGSGSSYSTYEGAGYMSGISPWLGSNSETPVTHLWKVKDSHVARYIESKSTTTTYSSSTVVRDGEEGFFFPYESDVCRDDDEGPVDLITQYFRPNFGRSFDSQTTMTNTLKSAWGILKRTSVGDELSHFVKACKLAIESQGAVRSIFSDTRYEGAVLTGYKLKVVIDGEVRECGTTRLLREELGRFLSHTVALTEIHTILFGSRIVRDDVEDTFDPEEEIPSMAALRELVLGDTALSVDQLDSIRDKALRLRYDNRRMQSNFSNIAQAIDIIAGKSALDGTWPIEARCVAEKDLLTTVLSGFGRGVPSLVVPDGRQISFAGPMPLQKTRIIEARGNKGARSVNTNDMELTIQARIVDLDTAVSDWKWMIEHHSYRVAPLTTAYANHYKVFKKNDRAVLYTALNGIANTSATKSGGSEENGKGKSAEKVTEDRREGVFEFVGSTLPIRTKPVVTNVTYNSDVELYSGHSGECILEWMYSRKEMVDMIDLLFPIYGVGYWDAEEMEYRMDELMSSLREVTFDENGFDYRGLPGGLFDF